MRVSIITTTYNRAEEFFRGIRSILIQENLPEDLEIVVIDDGSSDNTHDKYIELVDFAHKKKLDISWLYIWLDHPEPRISCKPRNRGIKEATGDLIIFTEPEGLHIHNTIQQLVEKAQENPDSVILASQVWTMGRNIQAKFTDDDFLHPARLLSHQYAMLTDSDHPSNTKAPNSDFAITGEAHCNAGVLFAARKDWLMEIGGFDESFEGFGFDDFDLVYRLGQAGHPLLKCSDIAIVHQYHDKSFYPYNLDLAAKANGEKSAKRKGYKANVGKLWGLG